MTVWYTSDLHLGHENIIKYSNRPFKSVSDMNEALIENFNSRVGAHDVVYILGDVALGPKSEWEAIFSRLNGYKILVVGNHEAIFMGNKDKYIAKYKHLYDSFDEIYNNLSGHWLSDGTIVNLSHYPYDGDHTDEDRYSEYRLPDRGRVLIHGHVHREYHGTDEDERDRVAVTKSKRGSLQIHVGMDNWDYKPVSEDRIIEILEKH